MLKFTHSSLVKFNFSVSEVGHLFERVNWYQHRADVRLYSVVKECHKNKKQDVFAAAFQKANLSMTVPAISLL